MRIRSRLGRISTARASLSLCRPEQLSNPRHLCSTSVEPLRRASNGTRSRRLASLEPASHSRISDPTQSIRSRFYATQAPRDLSEYFFSNSSSVDKNDSVAGTSQPFRSVLIKFIINHNPTTHAEMVQLLQRATKVTGRSPDLEDWEITIKVLLGWSLKIHLPTEQVRQSNDRSVARVALDGKEAKEEGKAKGARLIATLLEPEIVDIEWLQTSSESQTNSESEPRVTLEPPPWYQALVKGLLGRRHLEKYLSPNELHEANTFYQFHLDRRKGLTQGAQAVLETRLVNLLIQAHCSTFLPDLDSAFKFYDDLNGKKFWISEETYCALLLTSVSHSEIHRSSTILEDFQAKFASANLAAEMKSNSINGKELVFLGKVARAKLLFKLLEKSRNFKEAWDLYLLMLNMGKIFEIVSTEDMDVKEQKAPESHWGDFDAALEEDEDAEQARDLIDASGMERTQAGPFTSRGWDGILKTFMSLQFSFGRDADGLDSNGNEILVAEFIPPKSWMQSLWRGQSSELHNNGSQDQDQGSSNTPRSSTWFPKSRSQPKRVTSAPPELFLYLLKDMTLNGQPPTNAIYSKVLSHYSDQCKLLKLQASSINAELRSYRRSIANLHSILKADATLNPDIGLITNLMRAYSCSGSSQQVFQIWSSLVTTNSKINGHCLSVFLDHCSWTSDRGEGVSVLKEARHSIEWCKRHQRPALNKGALDSWIECLCRKGRLEEAFGIVFQEMTWNSKYEHDSEAQFLRMNSDPEWSPLALRLPKSEWPPRADVRTLEILLKFSARDRDMSRGGLRSEKERKLLERLNPNGSTSSPIRDSDLQNQGFESRFACRSSPSPWTPYSSSTSSRQVWRSRLHDFEGEPSAWHLVRKRIKQKFPWMWDAVKDIGLDNEQHDPRSQREK